MGVWKGFSTWIIEQAAPEAEVYCYDPLFLIEALLDHRKIGPTYRSKRASYSHQEFSCADIQELAAQSSRPLVFFDDHQNKLPRLLQAKRFGIHDIIFDDNCQMFGTHRTLEEDRRDPKSLEVIEREVQAYEIFPALWEVDSVLSDTIHIKEAGMNFPIERNLAEIYNDRQWHSYVTYVRLAGD